MRGPPSERQNSGAKALCLAFSGGGREVYCGESILGSDFHLLFTCWVLFMLPAVSQSGAGVSGPGVCRSAGRSVGTISSPHGPGSRRGD